MALPQSTSDDGVVEIEFAVTEPIYPFVSIAQSEECEIVLEKQLPREDGRQAEYFSVLDSDPEVFAERVSENDDSGARVILDAEQRSLVEVVVTDGCPAQYLAERRAIPTTVEGTPGGGKIVAEVLPEDDPGELVESFENEHAVELVAKRTQSAPTPLLSDAELKSVILEELTDRQREVLCTAFKAGYYRRPREQTGEQIADELDISSTTFQEHVRAAERKIMAFLVEEQH